MRMVVRVTTFLFMRMAVDCWTVTVIVPTIVRVFMSMVILRITMTLVRMTTVMAVVRVSMVVVIMRMPVILFVTVRIV
jgi:hypothetical protein